MKKKKIVFLTGTRADFGKLKPLIKQVDKHPGFESYLFVTGMHTLIKYGNTVDEVYKCFDDKRLEGGFRNIFVFRNQMYGEPMEHILANTIQGLSRFVADLNPDMIVIHGDRVEAMAGAIVGSLRNILVAHVEGGEVSGTIDELIRHSTSKMSQIHFVSNETAEKRLLQLGETQNSIFNIGSPDIDLMLSTDIPAIDEVKKHYKINYKSYGIVIFHPITTDLQGTEHYAKELVKSILALIDHNFVVIYPNNDEGSNLIFREYKKLEGHPHITILPSMRVEAFMSLLKNCDFLLGNSSAGVIEAPVYGVKTINITKRQHNRYKSKCIFSCKGLSGDIISLVKQIQSIPNFKPDFSYGKGDSAKRFMACLEGDPIWKISTQKQFVDL